MNTSHLRNLGLAALAMAAVVVAHPPVIASDPVVDPAQKERLIFERQFIMEQLDEDGELLGNISAGIEPVEKLAEVTRSIAKGAKDAVDSFRPILPGGQAKPEVWSNHADFMQRMETFAKNAEAMAKAGETGDLAAVNGLMVSAMPCKQCHDLYRAPKKPATTSGGPQ